MIASDEPRSMPERNAVLENWLRNEVVPTYDALMADPSRAISAADAWKYLSERMDKRAKDIA
jgi:antitoxin ParD1/3/4